MVLTSAKNPLLLETRKAILRGSLTQEGFCVAEGFHLLEEALRSDCEIKAVMAAESVRSTVESHIRGLQSVRLVVLTDALFREVSATESAQGVAALVRPPEWKLTQLFRGQSLVVILDGIQDPGNAGAIVRAAEAFGATGVAFLKGTVNPFNPKCVRASAGSLFRVPTVFAVDETLLRAALQQAHVDVYTAVPRAARSILEVNLTRPCAIILGSEGRGVSQRLRSIGVDLQIPTLAVESLNAAMAAGILLYEARRQRIVNA